MATNLGIDPDLLDQALAISGEKTKKATVNRALREFIARRGGNGWFICSEDWVGMAITTTSSCAPADEPVRGYRCLVSGTQTGYAAGAFRGAA